jgi:phospholipid transfer protein
MSQLLPPTERTWHGVQIPLPEGIDFVREVVTNHAVSG